MKTYRIGRKQCFCPVPPEECMLKYICRRFLVALPIFLGITAVVYIMSCLTPGNVINIMAGEGTMTKEAYDALVQEYHLDQPILIRYLLWLGGVLKGDLGISSSTSQSVASMIAARIGPTLVLTGISMLVSVLIAIPLGVMSAYKPYSAWDHASSVLTFIGASIPNFFLSLVAIYIFSVKFRLLPSQGMYTTGGTQSLSDLAVHLVLPVIVLSVQLTGSYLKQTRGAVL